MTTNTQLTGLESLCIDAEKFDEQIEALNITYRQKRIEIASKRAKDFVESIDHIDTHSAGKNLPQTIEYLDRMDSLEDRSYDLMGPEQLHKLINFYKFLFRSAGNFEFTIDVILPRVRKIKYSLTQRGGKEKDDLHSITYDADQLEQGINTFLGRIGLDHIYGKYPDSPPGRFGSNLGENSRNSALQTYREKLKAVWSEPENYVVPR